MILTIPTTAKDTYIKMCHEAYEAASGVEYALASAKANAYGRAINDICGADVFGHILMEADRTFPDDVDTCGGVPFTFKTAK